MEHHSFLEKNFVFYQGKLFVMKFKKFGFYNILPVFLYSGKHLFTLWSIWHSLTMTLNLETTISVIGESRATTLIVPEHEFLFRFLSPDQIFLQSGFAFVVALLSPIIRISVIIL